MAEPIKEPEDLGIKIGTPEEVFWTALLGKCEEMILQCEHEIEVQRHMHALCEAKVEAEKEKMKA